MHDEIKEILEKIKCPQFGSTEYGSWGSLPLQVRRTLKRLCDYAMSIEDGYINERYKNLKAIEIYENSTSIEYKQKRFMEDKTTADLMYDILNGYDNSTKLNRR